MNRLDELYSEFSSEDDFSALYVLGFLDRNRVRLDRVIAEGSQSERLLEIVAWVSFHLAVTKRSIEAVHYAEYALSMYPLGPINEMDVHTKRIVNIAQTALVFAFFQLRRNHDAQVVLKSIPPEHSDEPWWNAMHRLIVLDRERRMVKWLWYFAVALLVLEFSLRFATGHGSLRASLAAVAAMMVATIWGARNTRSERMLREELGAMKPLLKVVL